MAHRGDFDLQFGAKLRAKRD
uniref:Uncharacterized protein n=1 Tax=Anguilla anguilla TaxID=7936 RepID=A0A0E9QX93_ANGAN